jgi:predicted dinucleotide-binding enzyme
VVKSFNNLSAYTLLHGDTLTEHVKSVAASDDWEAAEATADFGRALGMEVRAHTAGSVQHNVVNVKHSVRPADVTGRPAGVNQQASVTA